MTTNLLPRIGILGGGQLGLMMIQSGISYGLDFLCLDPDKDAPAKSYCSRFFCGSLTDYDDVFNFGQHVDVVTIEIENVNVEALFDLEKQGRMVFPQARIIQLIQDKALQKQFFVENGFPTAAFTYVNSVHDIRSFPKVLKLRKAGYDGRGVLTLNGPNDLDKVFENPCILEDKIDFVCEVGIIVARNSSGQIAVYDPVDLFFEKNHHILDYLYCPSALLNDTQKNILVEMAKELITRLNMVGVLAIECFVGKDGQLLINEMSPRVHNSGHHSIEACVTSQFEQIIRCVLNLPLGSTQTKSNCKMTNILSTPDFPSVNQEWLKNTLNQENTFIHLYRKNPSKPYRKLGHVTQLIYSDEDHSKENS